MGLLGGDTMKVAHELPNSTTSHNLGINALYLIATLPEEELKKQGIARFFKKNGGIQRGVDFLNP